MTELAPAVSAPREARDLEWWVPVAVTILVALGLGAISPVIGDALLAGGAAGVLGGALLVVLAGAPTAWRLRRDGLDAPGLYALATIVLLGLTSLAWLGTPFQAGPGLHQDDIAAALRLVALGLLAFGVGARLVSVPRRTHPLTFDRALVPTRAILTLLFVVSLATVALGVWLGAYGYIADPAVSARFAAFAQALNVMGALGGLVVLATALIYFVTGDKQFLVPLVVFSLVQMSLGFFVGIKTNALQPVVFILLAYVAVRRRLPVKGLVVVALFTFVFLVPTNATFRVALRGGEAATPSQAVRKAISTPPPLDPATAAQETVQYILHRFRSIDSVALIHARTPSVFPFADGSRYTLLVPIILIPRAIWADKPTVTESGRFSTTYWQVPETVRVSTQLTQVGDLYRNFGYFGVALGLFCWGMIISGVLIAYRRWRSPRAEFIYLYLLVYAVANPAGGIESELPQLIANVTKTLPLVALVAWLLLPGRSTGPGYRAVLRQQTAR